MYKEVMELIKNSNIIYITQHIRPDGDAIGSSMAMYLALKNMGKDVKVIMSEYGRKYNFLPELKDTVKCVEGSYDLLICMDTSARDRLDIPEDSYNKAKNIVIIDHHKNSTITGDIRLIDENAPANCEIVYDFLLENDLNIDPKIAGYLYLGLLTDTGSFNYKRTTSHTYRVAADLIDKGADFVEVCKKINDTYPEARMKVVSYIIENMEVYFDGKVRMAVVDKEELKKLDATENDIEGIVNYLRMIEGTEVAIFIHRLTEENIYKFSLRTEGNIDGAKIALAFGGGGHIRASGFETKNLEKTKQELLNVIGVELNGEGNRDT